MVHLFVFFHILCLIFLVSVTEYKLDSNFNKSPIIHLCLFFNCFLQFVHFCSKGARTRVLHRNAALSLHPRDEGAAAERAGGRGGANGQPPRPPGRSRPPRPQEPLRAAPRASARTRPGFTSWDHSKSE